MFSYGYPKSHYAEPTLADLFNGGERPSISQRGRHGLPPAAPRCSFQDHLEQLNRRRQDIEAREEQLRWQKEQLQREGRDAFLLELSRRREEEERERRQAIEVEQFRRQLLAQAKAKAVAQARAKAEAQAQAQAAAQAQAFKRLQAPLDSSATHSDDEAAFVQIQLPDGRRFIVPASWAASHAASEPSVKSVSANLISQSADAKNARYQIPIRSGDVPVQDSTSARESTVAQSTSSEKDLLLSLLREHRAELERATAAFEAPVPSSLVFAVDATTGDEVAPRLAYNTPANKPLQSYEEELLRLLTKLDGVDSKGYTEVRDTRKEIVKEVELELQKVDQIREEAWRAHNVIASAEAKADDMEVEETANLPLSSETEDEVVAVEDSSAADAVESDASPVEAIEPDTENDVADFAGADGRTVMADATAKNVDPGLQQAEALPFQANPNAMPAVPAIEDSPNHAEVIPHDYDQTDLATNQFGATAGNGPSHADSPALLSATVPEFRPHSSSDFGQLGQDASAEIPPSTILVADSNLASTPAVTEDDVAWDLLSDSGSESELEDLVSLRSDEAPLVLMKGF